MRVSIDTMQAEIRLTADLFENLLPSGSAQIPIVPGAVLLKAFARGIDADLFHAFDEVVGSAPLRHLVTPGGHTMSVAMSNCGLLGWTSDHRGYRYTSLDPLTDKPWPAMPAIWMELAGRAAAQAGYADFKPDACLVNVYLPGAKMSLHQDRDEKDFSAPIVSLSLGLPAVFLFGGLQRSERPQRWHLEHGDVLVWGGPARLAFHGIAPLADGDHALLGRQRVNLTFRCAG